MPTFAEYAQGWWEWETCAYIEKRRKRRNLTRAYADNNKKNVKNHLVPYFGEMSRNRITREEVENWLDDLIEKDYQNTSINGYLGTLKTMLIEAAARKIIAANLTEKMEKLINDRKNIKIITPAEFKKLFLRNWRQVWDNDHISYTANKLDALGLKETGVFDLWDIPELRDSEDASD
jgi:site-specific recombinase XerD